ncbi:MAG TPA: hypothetical protein DCP95_10200, partial [Microbacterium ginsengisoli]|nr:hypothetical protein [Microbacterium ginsengisoli]
RAQAAARGDAEPTGDDLSEVIRRFMNTGNKPPSKRERQRVIAGRADPLAITNQIPAGALKPAQTGGSHSADEASESNPESVAARPSWPVAAPFGFTRAPDEE